MASDNALPQPSIVNYMVCASTCCLALHLCLIGLAKCSSREDNASEKMLKTMAVRADFRIEDVAPPKLDGAMLWAANSTPQQDTYIKRFNTYESALAVYDAIIRNT